MNKAEITFIKSFKEFGIKRFFSSISLYIAIVTTELYWYYLIQKKTYGEVQINFANVLVATSSGLFSLLFAAFAIIIALSDKEFILLLRKTNKLNNILFPFWLISLLYLCSIATNLIAIIDCGIIGVIAAVFGIFFFTFAITETFYLISTTVKFGLYRAEIYGMLNELKEAKNKKLDQ